MKKETLSVLFACAFGALIGALSALEIQSYFEYGSYFWGTGALFGGAIAYVAVDFRQFCSGVARSYRISIRNIADAYRAVCDWKPYKLYWKAVAVCVAGYGASAASLALYIYLGYWLVPLLSGNVGIIVGPILTMLGAVAGLLGVISAFATIFTPFLLSYNQGRWSPRRYEEQVVEEMEFAWFVLKYGNPIVFPFVVVGGLLCAILGSLIYLAKQAYSIAKYLWRNKGRPARAICFLGREAKQFVVRVFVFVHSERRALCFVDATLGAASGFLFGSAIAGAIIGAILGVINYELISIRWLKLVPIKK